MQELILIRHAQASFGADNYDLLSELGYTQSAWLGDLLAGYGLKPDRLATGTLRRHKETLDGIRKAFGDLPETEEYPGFNEYDFSGLLNAHHGGEAPEHLHKDQKAHFQALRQTLAAWQRDEIDNPPEMFSEFASRVEDARRKTCRPGAKRVLAVTSGGPIAEILGAALRMPLDSRVEFNMQVKNTSITRFIFNERVFYLHSFNETPHLDPLDRVAQRTYS